MKNYLQVRNREGRVFTFSEIIPRKELLDLEQLEPMKDKIVKYRVEIKKIEEYEYDEQDHTWVDKDTGKEVAYGGDNAVKNYFNTGRKLNRTDENTIFEQTLDEIDLNAIIKSINNL